MLQTADLIGIPFVDGGRSLKGFDCYGLVIELYRRIGIELPDYQIHCEDVTRISSKIDECRPQWERINGESPNYCLVVMHLYDNKFCNHTGVYLGNNQFIHTREKIGVNIDRIDSIAWKRKIEGFYTLREVNDVNANNT